jgi:hypothetical protein
VGQIHQEAALGNNARVAAQGPRQKQGGPRKMSVDQLKQKAESKSFRPFTISLVNGEDLPIEQAQDIHISRFKPYLISVFTKDGLAHLFEPSTVAKIAAS